jgi:hypothetical protein
MTIGWFFKKCCLLIGNTRKKQEAHRGQKGCCLFSIFFSETTDNCWLDCSLKTFCFLFFLIGFTWKKQEDQGVKKSVVCFKSYETTEPIETKLGTMVLYKNCFCWPEAYKRNKRTKGVKKNGVYFCTFIFQPLFLHVPYKNIFFLAC